MTDFHAGMSVGTAFPDLGWRPSAAVDEAAFIEYETMVPID
jgi:hypothetical protein